MFSVFHQSVDLAEKQSALEGVDLVPLASCSDRLCVHRCSRQGERRMSLYGETNDLNNPSKM